MTRPSVIIIAAFCAIVTIALAARQLRKGDSPTAVKNPVQMAAVAATAAAGRKGWTARPGPGAAAKAANDDRGPGAGAQGGSQGSSGLALAIPGAERRVEGGVAPGPGGHDNGGGPIRFSALPDSSRRLEGGSELFPAPDLGSGAGGFWTEAKEEDAVAEDGVVLSLPLTGTTDPVTGESPVVAEGVSFESDDGARFSADAQFAIPNNSHLTGEAGTIMFTVEPDWAGNDSSDASLVQLRTPNQWENRLQITKNGRYLRFIFTDNTGVESGAGVLIDQWQPGQRYNVTASWGEGLTTLYVNGRVVGQGTYFGQFNPPRGPLYIGSDHTGGQPGANATLSQVKIYNRVVAPSF